MEYQQEQSEDTTLLTFSGELTIMDAEQLKSALIEALNHSDHVVLDVQRVTALDLSALQLLCSAHRTAVTNGKQIRFGCPPPDILGKTAILAGFVREIGCDRKAEENCLWSGGDF